MDIEKQREFLQNFLKKASSVGINIESMTYREFMVNEFIKNPNLNMDDYLTYEKRIKLLEERIGTKIPEDFVELYKNYDGRFVMNGQWFPLESILLAKHFDIINFLVIEERPDLLSIEDCEHVIPLLVDNDAYIVMDLRDDGKGVFVIWADEEEIAFQYPTFSEFIKHIKEESKNEYFCFNYVDDFKE